MKLLRWTGWGFAYWGVVFSASIAPAGMLSPLATFGGGDGWRAPNEIVTGDTAGTATGSNYNYLGTGNLERGMSVNPVTGHVVLVSRSSAGNGIRLLDGTTGADVGALNQGSGIVSGGSIFAINMVDAAADGAIYVGNLTGASNFKLYRWGTEADAAPTVAFAGAAGVDRIGDTLAVTGSGSGTLVAAAGSATTNRSNFAVFNTADGLNYAATPYLNVPGTTTTSNDYRLGLTFVDSDTLIGNQGANARVTDFAATATVAATIPLGAAQRAMDYAVIGGRLFLAVIDSNSAKLQVFDVANPGSPVLVASGNNTSGTLSANANGTGSVAFANITASGATIYAMNSNQGIQAFELTGVPEPTGVALFVLGATLLSVTRRRAGR